MMTIVVHWMQRRLLQCLGAPIGTTLSSEPEPITDVRRQQERNQAKVAELQQELRRVEVERENNHAKVMQLQQELEFERENNQSKVMELQQQPETRAKHTVHTGRHSRRHRINHHHHHNHRGHTHEANEKERILSAEVAQSMSQVSEVVPLQTRVNHRIGTSSGLCVIS